MPLSWLNNRTVQLRCALASLSIIGIITIAYFSVHHYKTEIPVEPEDKIEVISEVPHFGNVSFLNLTRNRRNSPDSPSPSESTISFVGNAKIEGTVRNGTVFNGTITLYDSSSKPTNVSCILEDNPVLKQHDIEAYDVNPSHRAEKSDHEFDVNPFYNFEVITNETDKNYNQKSLEDMALGKLPDSDAEKMTGTVTYPTKPTTKDVKENFPPIAAVRREKTKSETKQKPVPVVAAVELEKSTTSATTITEKVPVVAAVEFEKSTTSTTTIAGENVPVVVTVESEESPASSTTIDEEAPTAATEKEPHVISAVEVENSTTSSTISYGAAVEVEGSTTSITTVKEEESPVVAAVEVEGSITSTTKENEPPATGAVEVEGSTTSTTTGNENESLVTAVEVEGSVSSSTIISREGSSTTPEELIRPKLPIAESVAKHSIASSDFKENNEGPLCSEASSNDGSGMSADDELSRVGDRGRNTKRVVEILSSVKQSLELLERIASRLRHDDMTSLLKDPILKGSLDSQRMSKFMVKEDVSEQGQDVRNTLATPFAIEMADPDNMFSTIDNVKVLRLGAPVKVENPARLSSGKEASELLSKFSQKLNKYEVPLSPEDNVGTIDHINKNIKAKDGRERGINEKFKFEKSPFADGLSLDSGLLSLFGTVMKIGSSQVPEFESKIEDVEERSHMARNPFVTPSAIAISPEILENSAWVKIADQKLTKNAFLGVQDEQNPLSGLFSAFAVMNSLEMVDSSSEDDFSKVRVRRKANDLVPENKSPNSNLPCDNLGQANLPCDDLGQAKFAANDDEESTVSSVSESTATGDTQSDIKSTLGTTEPESGNTEKTTLATADGSSTVKGTAEPESGNTEKTTVATGDDSGNVKGSTELESHNSEKTTAQTENPIKSGNIEESTTAETADDLSTAKDTAEPESGSEKTTAETQNPSKSDNAEESTTDEAKMDMAGQSVNIEATTEEVGDGTTNESRDHSESTTTTGEDDIGRTVNVMETTTSEANHSVSSTSGPTWVPSHRPSDDSGNSSRVTPCTCDHPHATHSTDDPHATYSTDDPHATYSTDDPHATHSTDDPHATHSTDDPHATHSTDNPHNGDDDCDDFDDLDIDDDLCNLPSCDEFLVQHAFDDADPPVINASSFNTSELWVHNVLAHIVNISHHIAKHVKWEDKTSPQKNKVAFESLPVVLDGLKLVKNIIHGGLEVPKGKESLAEHELDNKDASPVTDLTSLNGKLWTRDVLGRIIKVSLHITKHLRMHGMRVQENRNELFEILPLVKRDLELIESVATHKDSSVEEALPSNDDFLAANTSSNNTSELWVHDALGSIVNISDHIAKRVKWNHRANPTENEKQEFESLPLSEDGSESLGKEVESGIRDVRDTSPLMSPLNEIKEFWQKLTNRVKRSVNLPKLDTNYKSEQSLGRKFLRSDFLTDTASTVIGAKPLVYLFDDDNAGSVPLRRSQLDGLVVEIAKKEESGEKDEGGIERKFLRSGFVPDSSSKLIGSKPLVYLFDDNNAGSFASNIPLKTPQLDRLVVEIGNKEESISIEEACKSLNGKDGSCTTQEVERKTDKGGNQFYFESEEEGKSTTWSDGSRGDVNAFGGDQTEQSGAPEENRTEKPLERKFLRNGFLTDSSSKVVGAKPLVYLFDDNNDDSVANGLVAEVAKKEDSISKEKTCKSLDGTKGACKTQVVERKKDEGGSQCFESEDERKSTTSRRDYHACGDDESSELRNDLTETTQEPTEDFEDVSETEEPLLYDGGGKRRKSRQAPKREYEFKQHPRRKLFRSNLYSEESNDHLLNNLIGVQSLINSFGGMDDPGSIVTGYPMEIPSLDDLFKEIMSKFSDDPVSKDFLSGVGSRTEREAKTIEEVCRQLSEDGKTAPDCEEVKRPATEKMAKDCATDLHAKKTAPDCGTGSPTSSPNSEKTAPDCETGSSTLSSNSEETAPDCVTGPSTPSTRTTKEIAFDCENSPFSDDIYGSGNIRATDVAVKYANNTTSSPVHSSGDGDTGMKSSSDSSNNFTEYSSRSTTVQDYDADAWMETTLFNNSVTPDGQPEWSIVYGFTGNYSEHGENMLMDTTPVNGSTTPVDQPELSTAYGVTEDYSDHDSTNMRMKTTLLDSSTTPVDQPELSTAYGVTEDYSDHDSANMRMKTTLLDGSTTPVDQPELSTAYEVTEDYSDHDSTSMRMKTTLLDRSTTPVDQTEESAAHGSTKGVTLEHYSNKTLSEYVKDSLCLDGNCVLRAAELIRNLDLKSDPCEDFYRFSCGGFTDEMDIPQYKLAINQFNVLNDEQLDRIKRLLSKPVSKQDFPVIQEAKKFYNTCLNEDALRYNVRGFKKFIAELGIWPVLETRRTNKFDLLNHTVNFFQMGVNPNQFISFTIEAYQGEYLFHVSSAKLSLPSTSLLVRKRENYVKDAYYSFLKAVAELLGAKSNLEGELLQILIFEAALAEIVSEAEEFEQAGTYYSKMPLRDVIQIYPYINWLDIMQNLTPRKNVPSTVDDIVIKYPPYVEKLIALLKKTPARDLANYAIWRGIARLGIILCPEISGIFHTYFHDITNAFERLDGIFDGTVITLEDRPRWVECIDATKRAYSLALNHLYAKNFFDLETKAMVSDIAHAIKEEIRNKIAETSIMDDTTRAYAMDKINAMELCIGYSDELMDTKKITQYYRSVPSEQASFLHWYREMNLFEMRKYYSNVNVPAKHCDDLMALGDYARYRFEKNDFLIAARFLQSPLFHADRPISLNFGAVGFPMAHFMLHSVTFEGRLFDKQGKKLPHGWWGTKTLKKFMAKSQCLVEDYIRLKPSTFMGIKTINEFVVDKGAFEVVYDAYQQWIKGKSLPRLPGLENFSKNQAFWMSFGTTLCAKDRFSSTARVRLSIGVRNHERFAQDFRCRVNTKMNPSRKCTLWL